MLWRTAIVPQHTRRRNAHTQIRLCVNVRKGTVAVICPRHYVLLYTATFNQLININICDLLSMKLCIFYMFIYIYIYLFIYVKWVPGLSRGKVRPGRAAEHSPPFSAAVMEE